MDWIDRLERRFGRRGIPQLINGILIGQVAAGLVVLLFNRYFDAWLMLDRYALQHFQLWRLVTFLFDPIWVGNMLGFLNLLFYFWTGNALTRVWGDFKMTLYIALGVLGAWVTCLLFGYASADGIFLSILFAYAVMWPEQQVLLFGIIPFKIKWLGYFEAAIWLISFLMGGWATRLSLVLGLAGFFAFFGKELFYTVRDALRNYKRRKDWENRFK